MPKNNIKLPRTKQNKSKQEATNRRSQKIKYGYKFVPNPSMIKINRKKVESTQDPFA